jgi:FlaG/FlaF family flagellin (archaellin)
MTKAIASEVSALLLAAIAVTLAGIIVTFGGSLAVLGLLKTASASSYARVQQTSAPLRLVNWNASPAARIQQP